VSYQNARHPRGLYVLSAAEMCERFGFYLMAALFVLYMNEKLGWSESYALSANGWYKFFAYFTPIFGGILADRKIGYRRAVLLGTALLGAGYFLVSLPHMLFVAMALLVVGNGLFKPNISTMVGNLYPRDDPRRDDAFSIFYMGINIGAGVSPLVGEALRNTLGWTAAFMASGVAMVCSHIILRVYGAHIRVTEERSSVAAVLDVPLGPDYEDKPDPPEEERKRIIALLIMCGIVLIFWLSFQQNDGTMPLWARDNTDRVIPMLDFRELWVHHQFRLRPWEIPPGVFNAANPTFIVLLTPPIVLVLRWLRRVGVVVSTPTKIGLGMFLTAVSYVIMALAALWGGNTGRVSLWWLLANYLVITIAEIFLSPMGLSMVTKLAPRRMTAMLMGVWLLSTAIGSWLAGKTGAWFWKRWLHSDFFLMLVGASLLAFVFLITQHRRLKSAIPVES